MFPVVMVHQHYAQRKELVEHCFAGTILQQAPKRNHLLRGHSLLLLERSAAARTERELHRDMEMNQKQRREVNGRRHKRIVVSLLYHFLQSHLHSRTYRKHGLIVVTEINNVL